MVDGKVPKENLPDQPAQLRSGTLSTYAVLGDSISAGDYYNSGKWHEWFLSFVGPQAIPVGNNDADGYPRPFATSGFNIQQIVDTYQAAVIAEKPDAAFIFALTNGIPAVDFENEMVIYDGLVNALIEAGIEPIIFGLLTAPDNLIEALKLRRRRENETLRQYARDKGLYFVPFEDAIAFDAPECLTDPNFYNHSTPDYTHPLKNAHSYMGRKAADILAHRFVGPSEVPPENSPQWLNANPFMEGGNGTTFPTGWTLQKLNGAASTDSADVSPVFGKKGGKGLIEITASTGSTSAFRLLQLQNTGWAIGDEIAAYCEIFIPNGTSVRNLGLSVASSGGNFAEGNPKAHIITNGELLTIFDTRDKYLGVNGRTLKILTPFATVSSGPSGNLYPQLDLSAEASTEKFQVKTLGLFKKPN